MLERKVYEAIAETLERIETCQENARKGYGHKEVLKSNLESADALLAEMEFELLPSGGGFDSGTKINRSKSHAEKLVFETSFHHMNDVGYYDGWTSHTVTVLPSLSMKFRLRIGGRDRNEIKDYIHETFDLMLNQRIEYLFDKETRETSFQILNR